MGNPQITDVTQSAYNHFSAKKIAEDCVLLTTDNGSWATLSEREYGALMRGEVDQDPALSAFLEDRQIILTKHNIGRVVQDTRTRLLPLITGATLHIVAPTLRCNHKCVYCHAKSRDISAHDADMDEETARKTVDFIMQAPSENLMIEFQGGEPLAAFPTIQYIVDYAKERAGDCSKKVSFTLVSNLSLMDDGKLEFLMRNNFGLCTSLDGPKNVHDKNRPLLGGSSYETAVKWIEVIKKQKKYKLNALPTITRHSLGFAKEIIEEYRKWGFDLLRIRYLNNAGMALQHWPEIGYSPDEFTRFWKESVDYCLKLNREKKDIREGIAALFTGRIISRSDGAYTCLGMPCGAVISQIAYDHNGDIYSCDEARSFEEFKIGSVKTQSYSQALASKNALDIVDASSGFSSSCNSCVWRPYCVNCLVCNYGEQKNPLSKTASSGSCKMRAAMIEHVFKKLISGGQDARILRGWANSKN